MSMSMSVNTSILTTTRRRRQRKHRDSGLIQIVLAIAVVFGINVAVVQWTLDDQRGLLLEDQFEDLKRGLRMETNPTSLLLDNVEEEELDPRDLAEDVEPEAEPATATKVTEGREGYTAYAVVKVNFEMFTGQLRKPEPSEWQDLLCQIKAYFTVLLKRELNLDVYMTLVPINWAYNPGIDYPLAMAVIVNAFLEDRTPIHHEDVFRALRAMSVEEFLSAYVWKTMPAGQSAFFEVARLQEQVQVQSHRTLNNETTIGDLTLQDSNVCGDTGVYECTFYFGFFDRAREPGDKEVIDLVALTQSWLTGVLQTYFTHRVTVAIALRNWKFEPYANYQIKMKFQLEGRFVYNRGMMIPHEYVKEKLMEGANNPDAMKRYIKDVVWDTPPVRQSAFYYIKRVRMRNRIRRFAFEEPAFEGRYGELVNDLSPIEVLSEVEGGQTAPSQEDGATHSVVIPTFMLEPITVDEDTCEQHIKEANGDSNQYLTEQEYIDFVNLMTDNVFDGYPYTALPEAVTDVFESMSSPMPGSTDQVIDLLAAFRPAVHTDEEAQLLEETRADKLCFYFKDVLNTAIENGGVETARIDATLNFFLDRRTRPGEREDQDRGAVDSAFQHVVGAIRPMRPTLRALLRSSSRDLGRDLAVHVASEEAHLASLNKTECRDDGNDPNNACFMAQGEVQVYVKGEGSVDAAAGVAKNTEAALAKSVEDGTLNKEIQALDDSWSAEPMNSAPTTTPPVGRGVGLGALEQSQQTEPVSAPTRMPVFSPPTAAPTQEPAETISKSTVAAGVGGSVILMIALQCGREFLVDLLIKIAKICCKRYRQYRGYDDPDSEEFDFDDTQHTKGNQQGGDRSRTVYDSDEDPLLVSSSASKEDEEEEDEEEEEEEDDDDDVEKKRDIQVQPRTIASEEVTTDDSEEEDDETTDNEGEDSEEEESKSDDVSLDEQGHASQSDIEVSLDEEGHETQDSEADDSDEDEEAEGGNKDGSAQGNDRAESAGENEKDAQDKEGGDESAGAGKKEGRDNSQKGRGQVDEEQEKEADEDEKSTGSQKRVSFVPASILLRNENPEEEAARELPMAFGQAIDLDNLTSHVASTELQGVEVEEVDSDAETESLKGNESNPSLEESLEDSIRELEELEQDFVADLDNAMEEFTQASGARASTIRNLKDYEGS